MRYTRTMTRPVPANLVEPAPVRFTVEEFDRMCEAGIFGEDDRVELINGELYEMPPASLWHAAGESALNHLLAPAVGPGRGITSIHNSIRVSKTSELMPDVMVLEFRADFYREGGPRPANVFLIIEVSDTSARHDRLVKLPIYAAAGIPEVWIVTRDPAAIEVYREPAAGRYTTMHTAHPGETVAPLAFPSLAIPVSDITG